MSAAGRPSDDLREYYASAVGEVRETLEFRFLTDGVLTAARVVCHPSEDFVATLEDGAPLNGGETVTFGHVMFEFDPPGSQDQGLPTATMRILNAARLLMPWITLGVQQNVPVECTYRQYLTDNTEEPAYIVDGMTLPQADAGVSDVQAQIGFQDVLNVVSPRRVFTTKEYPGLAR